MSFDQNKKNPSPPANPGPGGEPQTSNYEEFGVTPDTLIEMPAIDLTTLAAPESTPKPEHAPVNWESPLAVAKPFGVLSSEPNLEPVRGPEEIPVSSEALAWLSGEAPPPASEETAAVGETLVMPKIPLLGVMADIPAEEAERPSDPETPPASLEATSIPEEPAAPYEKPSDADLEKLAAALSEKPAEPAAVKPAEPTAPKAAEPTSEAAAAIDPQAEDSLELLEEVRPEADEELSSQIGWSQGLPEKGEAQAEAKPLAPPPLPLPKIPPPTPAKAPPPPVPSGQHKTVSSAKPETKKSKLDLPAELFEDDPPTKAENAPAAPSPTLSMPKVLARGWWDTIFNEDFLRTNPAKSEAMTRKEADFIEQCLAPKPGDSILDVACGYGRHVIDMAGRNYNVVGLDLSLPYLMLAAEISTRRKLTANFVHGDMRDLQFKEYFDHAYCVFTSFGYFDDETNLESLRGIYRSLKPKGRFLLELINRDFAVSACPLRGWWEGIGCVMLEETEFNYTTSVLSTKRSVIFEDGRQAQQETHVRLYSLHEIIAFYKAVGFKILEVSGGVDLRGVFFGSDSTHLVILAEKQR